MMLRTRGVSSRSSTTSASCQLSRPDSAVPATARPGRDSRCAPRTPAGPRASARGREPTSRSSRSTGGGPAGAPAHRARGRAARRRRCARSTPCHPRRRRAAGWSCSRRREQAVSVARASVATPSSSRSSDTPSHIVSSFVHFVTQWMSTVTVSAVSARNSSQLHDARLGVDLALHEREAPLRERRVRRRPGLRRLAPGSPWVTSLAGGHARRIGDRAAAGTRKPREMKLTCGLRQEVRGPGRAPPDVVISGHRGHARVGGTGASTAARHLVVEQRRRVPDRPGRSTSRCSEARAGGSGKS